MWTPTEVATASATLVVAGCSSGWITVTNGASVSARSRSRAPAGLSTITIVSSPTVGSANERVGSVAQATNVIRLSFIVTPRNAG